MFSSANFDDIARDFKKLGNKTKSTIKAIQAAPEQLSRKFSQVIIDNRQSCTSVLNRKSIKKPPESIPELEMKKKKKAPKFFEDFDPSTSRNGKSILNSKKISNKLSF